MSRDELAEDRAAELGYREAGRRELALRDWYSLREPGTVAETPRAFAKLVNVLRVAKWQKANPEKKKGHALKYVHKPGVMQAQAAQAKKRRHRRYKAAAPVIVCAECRAQFCEARPRGGLPRKFCTERCGTVWQQRVTQRLAGRRETKCRLCGEPGHNKRRHA